MLMQRQPVYVFFVWRFNSMMFFILSFLYHRILSDMCSGTLIRRYQIPNTGEQFLIQFSGRRMFTTKEIEWYRKIERIFHQKSHPINSSACHSLEKFFSIKCNAYYINIGMFRIFDIGRLLQWVFSKVFHVFFLGRQRQFRRSDFFSREDLIFSWRRNKYWTCNLNLILNFAHVEFLMECLITNTGDIGLIE